MSLRTTVKVSNVTNLSDARYCAGMGVDLVGFSVDETSDQYVSPAKVREIRSWLAGVQIVAETHSNDASALLELTQTYTPDLLQVSHADLLPWLKSEGSTPLILRIEADQDADTIDELITKNGSLVTHFLIESSSGAPFTTEWSDFLQPYTQSHSILIGLPLSLTDIGHLAGLLPQAGIALRGSEEIRPGYTEFGELMDVLEALEEE